MSEKGIFAELSEGGYDNFGGSEKKAKKKAIKKTAKRAGKKKTSGEDEFFKF